MTGWGSSRPDWREHLFFTLPASLLDSECHRTVVFSSKTKEEKEIFIHLVTFIYAFSIKYISANIESIIKFIRNYSVNNTNCNKVNMLVLCNYHTCKSAHQSHTTKVMRVSLRFIYLIYFKLYKTYYHIDSQLFWFLCCVCWKNTKTSVYNSIYYY